MTQPRESHRRIVLFGLGWMYLSAALQGVAKLVVIAILARLLTPRDFGLLGIALIFTSLAERLGQVGVGPALIQRETIDGDDVVTGAVLSALSGVFLAIVLWVVAPWIAEFFREPLVSPIVRVLSLGFVIDGFSVTSDSLLQRSLGFKTMMLVENVSYIVGIGCIGALLASIGLGVWALVVAHISMRTIRAALLYHFAPRIAAGGRFNGERVRSLLILGGGFSAGRILNFASLQGDNFVVGRILGIDALGLYSRAYQLMALPAVYVAQVLERVLFPVLAKKQNDLPKVREAFLTVLELLALVSLPLGVFFLFAAQSIVEVVFGARWLEIAPILALLSFGVFFRTAYKCSDTVVRSLGAVYRYALQQGIYAVCIVVGSYIGGIEGGTKGVAIGVVLAVAVNYLLMTRLSATLVSASWDDLVMAHVSGVWTSSWLVLVLSVTDTWIRSAFPEAMSQLIIYSVLSLCTCSGALLSGYILLPGRVLHTVFPYVASLVTGRWKGAHT